MVTPLESKLIELGTALARSLGHNPVQQNAYGCPKASPAVPCICGAGREQAKALDDWQHLMADVRNMSSFSDNKLDI